MSAEKKYYSYSVELEDMMCRSCGIAFAVSAVVMNHHREKAGSYYCPNGHQWTFTESEASKLRKQLEAEKQKVVEANAARWKAEEAKTKVERKLRKTEKRIAGGVCPCCNRHFVNVERHMKTKHPDLGATETKTA